MNTVGIICDLNYMRHPQFRSYYYSLETLIGHPKVIHHIDDLEGLDLLVVGDDHYSEHKVVLHQPGFIERCNELDLPVLVMTTERIMESFFPWNIKNYEKIQTIKHLIHYTADVDDCEKLGIGLHRISISKRFKNLYKRDDKKDGAIFIGQTRCDQGSYVSRKKLLIELEKEIGLTIVDYGISCWEEYMRLLGKFRFVVSPLGNGNFFPTRFYEALAVGSIPIQQVRENTLSLYDVERDFRDCIFFRTVDELKEKLDVCGILTSHNEFWAEDNLQLILKENHLC